jgi:hypothetical protein
MRRETECLPKRDEEAAPNKAAIASDRSESSGSSRFISDFDTTA